MPALLASYRIARQPTSNCCEFKERTFRLINLTGRLFIYLNAVILLVGDYFELYYLFWYSKWFLLGVPFVYTLMMVCTLYFIVKAVSNANLKKMQPDWKMLAMHIFLVLDSSVIQILMYLSYT